MTIMTADRPALRLVDGGAEHPNRKSVRLSSRATWFYQLVPGMPTCVPQPGESAASSRIRWACELAAAEEWLDAEAGAPGGVDPRR